MININRLVVEMNLKNEESHEIEGIGKIYLKKDGKIPYLLYIPEKLDDKERLVVEVNNRETDRKYDLVNQAASTMFSSYAVLSGRAPVLVPIIPSGENKPYYQQLSRDAFYEKEPLHVEEEVSKAIKDSLKIIEEEKGVKLDDKVFMKGYSSSGVFAQRFALFHPEQIDTLLVGGASGSIPIPSNNIDYPLGIGGLKDFDSEAYSKIKFRYYVGEFETVNYAQDRQDVVDGKIIDIPMPMHDMTYFPRSINPYTGKKYREYFGEDYFRRVDNVVKLYEDLGLDIKHTVIEDRAHKSMMVGNIFYEGINELNDKIIDDAYKESVKVLVDSRTK